MAMLRIVAKASGGDIRPGWNLIVLHHNDCGITGLVYDVTTGRIEIVVPTSLLRPENPS